MLTNSEDFLKYMTFQTKKMAAVRPGVTVNLPQLKICVSCTEKAGNCMCMPTKKEKLLYCMQYIRKMATVDKMY